MMFTSAIEMIVELLSLLSALFYIPGMRSTCSWDRVILNVLQNLGIKYFVDYFWICVHQENSPRFGCVF